MNHEFVSPDPIGFSLAYCFPFVTYKDLQHPSAPFNKTSLEQVKVIIQPFVKEQAN